MRPVSTPAPLPGNAHPAPATGSRSLSAVLARCLTTHPVPAPAPSRRATWALGSGIVLGCLGPMVYSPVGWALSSRSSFGASLLELAAWVTTGVLVVLVRRRAASCAAMVLVATLAPLILPLGSAPAVICLGVLISRHRGPGTLTGSLALIASSTLVAVRDAMSDPIGASWIKYVLHGEAATPALEASSAPDPLLTAVSWHLLALVLSIGVGAWLRLHWEKRTVSAVADQALAHSERLDAQIARTQERERIAREVHDAIGHRLSVISLHAGALEGSVPADSPAAESARAVRQAASAAVDDLHSLLRMLREPAEPELADVPLSRLRDVLDEAAAAGQAMSASVFLEEAEQAPPVLSRAVFRIVQELLTNAARHAPGATLTLRVSGAPGQGLLIESANPLLPQSVTTGVSGGHGLGGIRERVDLLGGSMSAGADEGSGAFRVRIELPWQ